MRLFVGLLVFFGLVMLLVKIISVVMNRDIIYTYYQVKTITIFVLSIFILSGVFYFLFKKGILKYKK